MEINDFLSLFKRKKKTIFTIVFIFVMLAIITSLAQNIKYTVKSRLLVIQNTSISDAYSLSKSNEYLGNLFAEVVYSGSFYDQVISSNYNIDQSYFSGHYGQQIARWKKTVETKSQGNTGIIEIYVYHPQSSEAKKIALAVNDILINKNQAYQGGQAVKVSIIDQPIASNYPNKPDLFQNILLALVIALVFSSFYVYILPEEKYNLSLLPERNKNKLKKLEVSLNTENYQSISQNFNNLAKEVKNNDANFYQHHHQENVVDLSDNHKKDYDKEALVNKNFTNNQSFKDGNQVAEDNKNVQNSSEYRTLNGDINSIIRRS